MSAGQEDDLPQEEEAMLDTYDDGTFGDQPNTPQKAEAKFREFHQLDPWM